MRCETQTLKKVFCRHFISLTYEDAKLCQRSGHKHKHEVCSNTEKNFENTVSNSENVSLL